MGEITDINAQAKAAAENASKPGVFSFIDRVTNRNYPKDQVVAYLDEDGGYKIQAIDEERENIRLRTKLFKGNETVLAELGKELAKLDEQHEAIRESMADSRFVFELEGISTKLYDECVDAAQEQFPLEYRETRHPVTFALERHVIENEQREVFFRTLLWSKFIRRVTDPAGNVDENITPEWVGVVEGLLPVVAQIKIQETVHKLRMTTGWMDELQGEDFLAKS